MVGKENILSIILLCAVLALPACKGKRGDQGKQGEQGPTGATGPTGPSQPTPTPICTSQVSAGVTTTTSLSYGAMNASQLGASAVTLSASGTAVSIGVAMLGVVAPQGRYAIYADNGSNQPGKLILETNPVGLTASSWNYVSLPTALYLPAGTYWVAQMYPAENSLSYEVNGGVFYYDYVYGWSAFPDSFPLSGYGIGNNTIKMSINLKLCP